MLEFVTQILDGSGALCDIWSPTQYKRFSKTLLATGGMREQVMRHRATWVIFFVALALRALLILTLPRSAETFNDEPGQVAIALSQGDGFSNPYSAPSGPTAHVRTVRLTPRRRSD